MNAPAFSITARQRRAAPQHGVMLLEALVAILIFSLGVLSVIQLQAVSIKQASGAEQRSTAALLANDLVSRMWASDKTALQTNYASETTNASGYNQWLSTVLGSGLPNVSRDKGTLPEVKFATGPVTPSGAASLQATISLYWIAPGDSSKHSYTTVAQFK